MSARIRRFAATLLIAGLSACSLVESYPDLAPDPSASGGGDASSAATSGASGGSSGTSNVDCDGDPACAGALRWSKRFGDGAQQDGTSLAADSAGDVWLTGSFEGALDFGTGPLTGGGATSAFIAKLSATGEPRRQAVFGDALGRGVTVDGRGDAIVGVQCRGTVDFCGGDVRGANGNNHDVCLAKLDPDAGCLWTRRFGDRKEQWPAGVAVDEAGRIAVAGSFGGQIDFGGSPLQAAGGIDLFVAAFNADGGVEWAKGFGAGSDEIAAGVAIDASGVVIAGYASGPVDFGGGALPPLGGEDIVVAKLDRQGNHVWSQRYGSIEDDRGLAVAVDATGDVLVTGSFRGAASFQGTTLTAQGARDIFLRKMTSNGAEIFTKGFGDGADQVALGVATAGGGVVLTGRFQGALSFGGAPLPGASGMDDIFVAKLDATGGHLWSHRFGDSADQLGAAVAIDRDGDALLTGTLGGAADFGAGLLTSAGVGDLFVAKFAP